MIKIKFVKLWDLISYLERASWKLSTRPNASSLWQMDINFFISPIFSIILHWILQFRSSAKLKTSQHNHSMSNLGLFFLSSKWAEFLHVLSDLIESHSPVFFYAGLRFVFQLKHTQKNLALFAVCCWTTSKRNLLFSQTMKPVKRPVAACFLHTFLLENEAQTSGKNKGCDFLFNWRPHAKINFNFYYIHSIFIICIYRFKYMYLFNSEKPH